MKNKKIRQYRSNQGRSPKQLEDSLRLASVGFIGCTIILVLLIFNSIIR